MRIAQIMRHSAPLVCAAFLAVSCAEDDMSNAPAADESSEPVASTSMAANRYDDVKKWNTNGVLGRVPYINASSCPQSALDEAARMLKAPNQNGTPRTPIKLVKISSPPANDGPYVKFIDIAGTASYARAGMASGNNNIKLAQGGNQFGCNPFIIVHEVMHELGFAHEHQRSDRSNKVCYKKTWVHPDRYSQFNPEGDSYGAYNVRSIMHYTGRWFVDNEKTVDSDTASCTMYLSGGSADPCVNRGACVPIRKSVTDGDIAAINDRYSTDGGTNALGPEVLCDGPDLHPESGNMQTGGLCASPVDGGEYDSDTPLVMTPCVASRGEHRWEGFSYDKQVVNELSNMCMHITGAAIASGDPVEQRTCDAINARQDWVMKDMEILNGGSMKCIDVPGSDFSANPQLQLWACNDTAAQKFRFRPTYRELRTTCGGTCAGKCLTAIGGPAEGAPVALRDCDGSYGQNWVQGERGFISGDNEDFCLTIEGGSTLSGAKLITSSCKKLESQRFALRGDVRSFHDESLCLQGSAIGGTQLTLATCNSNVATQTWTMWSGE
jgi:hypothetical protein